MRQHYDKRGLELNAARLRMATLPATAEVLAFTLPLMQAFMTYACIAIYKKSQSKLMHKTRRF